MEVFDEHRDLIACFFVQALHFALALYAWIAIVQPVFSTLSPAMIAAVVAAIVSFFTAQLAATTLGREWLLGLVIMVMSLLTIAGLATLAGWTV